VGAAELGDTVDGEAVGTHVWPGVVGVSVLGETVGDVGDWVEGEVVEGEDVVTVGAAVVGLAVLGDTVGAVGA
jgi:hypothetical protein